MAKMSEAKKVKKKRLDELLVERGLADSRAQAKAFVIGGKVRSGTQRLDKAGKTYPEDIKLEVLQPPRFVSRGGEKLLGFIKAYPMDINGLLGLDVGASTGGFTDCMLQHGVREVTCVDVGRAQLHNKLIQDPRVTNLEKVNARYLTADQLPHPEYDIIVMDLSFISLKMVLPAIWPLLKETGRMVSLVKPQFEAGKEEVDKGHGIIRDAAVHERVLEEIRTFAREELKGSKEMGCITSPIKGTDGNKEFLVGWTKA